MVQRPASGTTIGLRERLLDICPQTCFSLLRERTEQYNMNYGTIIGICSLRGRITSAVHIEEFISLWVRIQDVHLQQGVRDSIVWRWTSDGVYSIRSAYQIQCNGSFGLFLSDLIWRAQVENKCKIFVWILVQDKIFIAHNL
jgi:hypothetical protein